MPRKTVRSYRRYDPRAKRMVEVGESSREVSQTPDNAMRVPQAHATAASDPLASPLDGVRNEVSRNAERVAHLGDWPEHVSPESLTRRIPEGSELGPGFDAGIACSLGMIPEEKQRLAAKLHAAYTPDAVAQVRREMGLDGRGERPDADSESVWWLAACSVCREGSIDEGQFQEQLHEFEQLRDDPQARLDAAKAMLEDMLDSYEVRDGVPMATRDGGMQGAYLDGHRYAAHHAEDYGIYFVGTYEESLGVEDFAWKHPPNPDGETRDEQLGRSGPVFGSRQFVKAADEGEMRAVVAVASERLRR